MHTKAHPDDLVPEEVLKSLRARWGMEMFKQADVAGELDMFNRTPIPYHIYLMSGQHAGNTRDKWEIDDAFDFTTAPYWIGHQRHPSEPGHGFVQPIPSAEFLGRKFCVFEDSTTYNELSHDIFCPWGRIQPHAIIDAGVGVNHRGWPGGQTALHVCDDLELSAILIANGADVNAVDDDGNIPLHMIDNLDHPAVAKLLIAHGADVNARAKDGRTPLHNVRYLETAEALLANGADANAQDIDGATPLDCASEWVRVVHSTRKGMRCTVREVQENARGTHRVIAAAASRALIERELSSIQGANDSAQEPPQRRARRM